MLVFSVCYPMVLQKYCRNLLPCILSYTWHLFYAGDDIIEDWVYLILKSCIIREIIWKINTLIFMVLLTKSALSIIMFNSLKNH